MTPLLQISKVNVSYGKLSAVRDASIELHQSKIVTIIGPNGAGKTTLLKALMGMLSYNGAVRMEGQPLDRLDIEERVERGLILVPETRELFTQMPVRDNLLLGAYLHRSRKDQIAADLI